MLDLLGPVWRREARLVRAAGHLTPAPFEPGPAAGKRRVMFQPPRPWAAPGSAPPEK